MKSYLQQVRAKANQMPKDQRATYLLSKVSELDNLLRLALKQVFLFDHLVADIKSFTEVDFNDQFNMPDEEIPVKPPVHWGKCITPKGALESNKGFVEPYPTEYDTLRSALRNIAEIYEAASKQQLGEALPEEEPLVFFGSKTNDPV